MSRIRSKDTKPELMLRRELFKRGFRYRIHVNGLPGKPDIVLPKYNTVIFVHGCFWHMHENCRDGRLPKSKLEYWEPKLTRNVMRDNENIKQLKAEGYNVIIVWECEVHKEFESTLKRLLKNLSVAGKKGR